MSQQQQQQQQIMRVGLSATLLAWCAGGVTVWSKRQQRAQTRWIDRLAFSPSGFVSCLHTPEVLERPGVPIAACEATAFDSLTNRVYNFVQTASCVCYSLVVWCEAAPSSQCVSPTPPVTAACITACSDLFLSCVFMSSSPVGLFAMLGGGAGCQWGWGVGQHQHLVD